MHFGDQQSIIRLTMCHGLFAGSGSCPECGLPLRRNNYRVQMFEDPQVEKEVDIRRRILRDFNKKVSIAFSHLY